MLNIKYWQFKVSVYKQYVNDLLKMHFLSVGSLWRIVDHSDQYWLSKSWSCPSHCWGELITHWAYQFAQIAIKSLTQMQSWDGHEKYPGLRGQSVLFILSPDKRSPVFENIAQNKSQMPKPSLSFRYFFFVLVLNRSERMPSRTWRMGLLCTTLIIMLVWGMPGTSFRQRYGLPANADVFICWIHVYMTANLKQLRPKYDQMIEHEFWKSQNDQSVWLV